MTIRTEAHAKINLSLDVVGRRDDGYHELDMVLLEVSLYEPVELSILPEPGIRLVCSDASLENEKNLAWRAAALMLERYRETRGVSITIEKKIPMQAGLGGGSSDAAAVLRGMNELFGFGASSDELRTAGLKLGADVPFFIEGGCMRAKGVGEKLTPVPCMPDLHILIVKPAESISTAYAYGNLKYGEEAFHPDIDGLLAAFSETDVPKAARCLGNSLENAVTDEYPVILSLKKSLAEAGALGALMTGSGSAVFGLFPGRKDAEDATGFLQKQIPGLKTFYCTGVTRR